MKPREGQRLREQYEEHERMKKSDPKGILLPIVQWRFGMSPITIDFARLSERNYLGETIATTDWKALYIFGVRLVAWRVIA